MSDLRLSNQSERSQEPLQVRVDVPVKETSVHAGTAPRSTHRVLSQNKRDASVETEAIVWVGFTATLSHMKQSAVSRDIPESADPVIVMDYVPTHRSRHGFIQSVPQYVTQWVIWEGSVYFLIK
jgi:hypothetical protein